MKAIGAMYLLIRVLLRNCTNISPNKENKNKSQVLVGISPILGDDTHFQTHPIPKTEVYLLLPKIELHHEPRWSLIILLLQILRELLVKPRL